MFTDEKKYLEEAGRWELKWMYKRMLKVIEAHQYAYHRSTKPRLVNNNWCCTGINGTLIKFKMRFPEWNSKKLMFEIPLESYQSKKIAIVYLDIYNFDWDIEVINENLYKKHKEGIDWFFNNIGSKYKYLSKQYNNL